MVLTVLAVVSIIGLWFKMQKAFGGKSNVF